MRASNAEVGETLRLYRPDPILAFGRLDRISTGFERAASEAKAAGFTPVLRLVGGRAAVFHEETIAFAWTIPDPSPASRTFARFDEAAAIIKSGLNKLGVDARVGEVPLEYCPGDYSINARGRKKLVGIGQRVVSKAAHVGGVIVVGGSDRVSEVLLPVYDALELKWDPGTVGSVQDEISTSWEAVEQAVLGSFTDRFDMSKGYFDEETLMLAERLEPDHQVDI